MSLWSFRGLDLRRGVGVAWGIVVFASILRIIVGVSVVLAILTVLGFNVFLVVFPIGIGLISIGVNVLDILLFVLLTLKIRRIRVGIGGWLLLRL